VNQSLAPHLAESPAEGAANGADRPTRAGLIAGLTLVGAIGVALVARGPGIVGFALLFLIFVPLEKLFALRPQKMFRRGFVTDFTHLLVNRFFVTIGAIVLAITIALPFIWVRSFHIVDALPGAASVPLAATLAFVGNYWGHRLTHRIPFLWRFHAVHHSIREMDWVAAGRLHPLDSAFTQAFTIVPLFLLGYSGGVFASVAVGLTLLAIFQHANVRLRFPVVRWVLPTPEWHHWHHAIDDEAINKNFGLPVVDKVFGTAYLPRDKRLTGFGIHDPVPPDGYFRHIAYPFTQKARARATGQASEQFVRG
jgi:sterol desaturase/sphingolipid hydroxylase (fatty acid hydroxylase superfamily)